MVVDLTVNGDRRSCLRSHHATCVRHPAAEDFSPNRSKPCPRRVFCVACMVLVRRAYLFLRPMPRHSPRIARSATLEGLTVDGHSYTTRPRLMTRARPMRGPPPCAFRHGC